MNLSFENKIRLAFLLSLVCLLWIGGMGYFHATRSMATYRLADQAYQVLDELQSTWIGLLNAETAAKSYAVSGYELALKPYQSALESIASGHEHLRLLTADNPEQQHNLDQLEPLLTKKLGWIANAIESRRANGSATTPSAPSLAEEAQTMDEIRHWFATMGIAERHLLVARFEGAQGQARRTMEMLMLGSALAVAFLAFATLVVHRGFVERQRAETERDRFFNLARDLMCIAGSDGHFKSLNPVWEQVLGYSRAELMAQPFLEFVHPNDRGATLLEMERLDNGGEVMFFENRYRCKDGSYRWLSWSARKVAGEGLVYATARDVTEPKQAHQQIAHLNEALRHRAAELEAANKELEAFSYSVSHDLRAPLRHLGGFVDLLRRRALDTLDEKSKQHLANIAGSAQQMGRLVDDLLSFSRMARAEMRQHRISLDRLVGEVRAELRREAKDRDVQWKVGALPDVYGDAPMLRVAILNLLGNALKYTRPRQPAIIEVGAEANESEHTIFVRDNGVGFDMRYVAKLFGVFQRLHYEDEFEGAGIGLASVRRIVGRHGGRTWAEGKEGEGATFYFTLPKVPEIRPPAPNGQTQAPMATEVMSK